MGNTPSSPSAAAGRDDSSLSATDQKAFHVLQVSPNSPASRAKLVPYFDYIVSVNGITVLQESPNVVAEMARSSVERPLRFGVYNARTDSVREVSIVPSRNWGGEGLLGCSIRYSTTLGAVERAWRILEVYEKSPALRAGLIPEKDWIIAAADLNILNDADFTEFLIQNKKHPVRLVVYNSAQDVCRIVSIVPDFEWGGPGCLGCDIGTGVLNRIPPPTNAQVVPSAANSERSSLLSATTPVSYANSPNEIASANVASGMQHPASPSFYQPPQPSNTVIVPPPPSQFTPPVTTHSTEPVAQPSIYSPAVFEPHSSPIFQIHEQPAEQASYQPNEEHQEFPSQCAAEQPDFFQYQQPQSAPAAENTAEPQVDYFAMLSAGPQVGQEQQPYAEDPNIANFFGTEAQSIELLPSATKTEESKRKASTGGEFGEVSLQ